jgi:regulator of PEP synthase PpsR (kinase-PPPase family)
MEVMKFPKALDKFRHKIFGLSIDPSRLSAIRSERRPNSKYASLKNCETEVRLAKALMDQEGIPHLDTTSRSIEELATVIVQQAKLHRKAH